MSVCPNRTSHNWCCSPLADFLIGHIFTAESRLWNDKENLHRVKQNNFKLQSSGKHIQKIATDMAHLIGKPIGTSCCNIFYAFCFLGPVSQKLQSTSRNRQNNTYRGISYGICLGYVTLAETGAAGFSKQPLSISWTHRLFSNIFFRSRCPLFSLNETVSLLRQNQNPLLQSIV